MILSKVCYILGEDRESYSFKNLRGVDEGSTFLQKRNLLPKNMLFGGKMKNRNHIKIQVSSNSCNIDNVCEVVKTFAAVLTPSEEELGEICGAVREAVKNCVKHAYKNTDGIITIVCDVLKNNTLRIIVKDNGVGIKDVESAMAPFYTTSEESSGFGFTIIDAFMSSIKVTSSIGKGTIVNMKKVIKTIEA